MKPKMHFRRTALLVLLAAFGALATDPQFEVQLKKSWIEAYKDRTSIEASMVIHHSHKKPNKVGRGSEDGDLHFSGESDDVGLPFVAEVVNAASESKAVAFIKSVAATNETSGGNEKAVAVTGAWRFWFEHPSKLQIQGGNNPFTPDHTNPNHSFEIHPVSSIGPSGGSSRIDVEDSFVPVQDPKTHARFEAYPAETAFPYFDGITARIKASRTGVSIRAPQLRYNYVDFHIELTQKAKQVSDGYIALARVVSEDGEQALPSTVRMIFVRGTEGAKAMSTAAAGDGFHVLGIPRVNLNAVSFLVGQHGTTEFSARLPYEMIVVGVFSD